MNKEQSKERQNDVKERLLQKINELKNDIQYIIDSSKSKTLDLNLQQTKKDKLTQLKQMSDQLKQIYKTEQQSQTFTNKIKKAYNENDSINFKSAKHKNNQESMSKARQDKLIRKETMNKYIEFLEEQKFYNKFESDKIPSCLFLHDTVLSTYGLCPYINIANVIDIQPENKNNLSDVDTENYKNIIHDKRKSWLDATSDNGKIYWDLYDKIFNKKELFNYYKQHEFLQKQLEQFVHNSMTENQLKIYDSCIEIIKEYTSSQQKNKMLREKYKSVTNNLSILVSELGYDLHYFLSTKFNTNIVVNYLKDSIKNDNKILKSEFDTLLTQFNFLHEEIKYNEKFIINSKNNLNNEIYLFLTNQKSFNNLPTNESHISFVQSKKYFKRWALLTENEKFERFESFANYYVDKYLITPNIIPIKQRDTQLTFLIDLLQQAHKNKELIYRDIKWNNNDGVIEQVKSLRFNKETGQLYLNPSKKGTSAIKKKFSVKTILSKESEKFINEEILCHIVIFFQKYPDQNERKQHLKENKEACLELIKNKLRIKKITNEDKKQIFQKYDNMFNVVDSNN